MSHYQLNDAGLLEPVAPHILKRRYIEGEVSPSRVAMGGRFRLLAYAANGLLRHDTGFFDNLVLDAGLNRWGTGAIINGAAIGSGTSAPLANQTQLDSLIAYSTTLQGEGGAAQATAPYFYTLTTTWRFTFGSNQTIREVGVGWASTTLFSRALVVDPGGTPTDISMLAGETLDVVYQLRMYPPTTDFAATLAISGTNYDIVGRAINVDQAIDFNSPGNDGISIRRVVAIEANGAVALPGPIGAIDGVPSGTNVSIGSVSNPAYSNGSLQRQTTVTSGLNDGNVPGGIGAVKVFWRGTNIGYQYGFTPKLPKDNTKTMTLNFTHSWARRS